MQFSELFSFIAVALLVTVLFAGLAMVPTAYGQQKSHPISVWQNVSEPKSYSVSIGENARWGGVSAPYNVYGWGYVTYGDTTAVASAEGTSLTTSLDAPFGEEGLALAELGVFFNITGVSTKAQWDAVKTKTVTVITTQGYTLKAASSTSAGWENHISVYTGFNTWGYVAHQGNTSGTLTSPPVAKTITTTLEKLSVFRPGTEDTPGSCMILVELVSQNSDVESSVTLSGNVTVPSIELKWPSTPTPTPTVTPSPTVSPSSTPTVSPSSTPTVSPSASPSASPSVTPPTSPTPPVKPSPEFPLAMAGAGTVMLVLAGIYVLLRRRR